MLRDHALRHSYCSETSPSMAPAKHSSPLMVIAIIITLHSAVRLVLCSVGSHNYTLIYNFRGSYYFHLVVI